MHAQAGLLQMVGMQTVLSPQLPEGHPTLPRGKSRVRMSPRIEVQRSPLPGPSASSAESPGGSSSGRRRMTHSSSAWERSTLSQGTVLPLACVETGRGTPKVQKLRNGVGGSALFEQMFCGLVRWLSEAKLWQSHLTTGVHCPGPTRWKEKTDS